MSGFFITFEGSEGGGKTTQVSLLAEALRARGHEVVETREPGGTPIGQTLRQLLLRPRTGPPTDAPLPPTELLLMLADRAQHIHEVILPGLHAGRIVLCDRYADSTTAYQGYGRGFDLAEIARLNAFVCAACQPKLTFVLDLPVAVGMRRAYARRGGVVTDPFETAAMTFHERVREGFLSIARTEPERVCLIDAAQDIEAVHVAVLAGVRERLPALL